MKWSRTLDTWTAEGAGGPWLIRKRPHGCSIFLRGGFVAGGFKTVKAAKQQAEALERAEDTDAAVAERHQQAGEEIRKRWLRAAGRKSSPRR